MNEEKREKKIWRDNLDEPEILHTSEPIIFGKRKLKGLGKWLREK